MGRKNKKNVIDQELEPETSEITDSSITHQENLAKAADDDQLIPFHTRQAGYAMLYLVFCSILMFTLPFAAFYGTQRLLDEYFHVSKFENTCWSVLAAVMTVNAIIILYAWKGFKDAQKEEQEAKRVNDENQAYNAPARTEVDAKINKKSKKSRKVD